MDEDSMSVEEKRERYLIVSEIDNLISTNEIKQLQSLLERHQAKLPELRYIGKTILHMAVDHNNLEVCEQILQAGISVNIINEHYITALPYAVEQGNIHIVSYLLQQGARVDGDPRGYYTPLMEAVKKGHIELVQLLLAHGANVNRLQVNFNVTPLDMATASKHDEIIALLQAEGGRHASEVIELEGLAGSGVLAHMNHKLGPILSEQYYEDGISVRTALIDKGNYYKAVFTFGNFAKQPRCEFLITVPYNWVLNQSIYESNYPQSFPIQFLLLLSQQIEELHEIREGSVFERNDSRWSYLPWPDGIDALIAVDYAFDHQMNEEHAGEIEDETVLLLLLVPIKYPKVGKPQGEKLEKWIEKRRTASWKSVMFKHIEK